ncbi:MAG: glutamine amidotransferase-related protein [Gemmatimonadaceae bacterium]
MHVGLLACDEVAERFRHIAGGYQEMFERLLSPHILGLRLTRFDVQADNTPRDPRTCDAWITTGSRASVYDDAAWIRTLERFVRQIADSDRPFVGVCFGHQLLARTLGADVKRAPGGWGVGVLPMRVVHREDWMAPALSTVRLQYMHADQVMEPPDGATLLGEATHCPVAMFQQGPRLMGIEAHPEFPAAYARALIDARRSRIGEEVAEDGLARVDEPTDSEIVGGWIARCFRANGALSAPTY